MHLAFASPTAGLDARVGRPRPLPRPIRPVSNQHQLYSLRCHSLNCTTIQSSLQARGSLECTHSADHCNHESMETNLVLLVDTMQHQSEMLKLPRHLNWSCLNLLTGWGPWNNTRVQIESTRRRVWQHNMHHANFLNVPHEQPQSPPFWFILYLPASASPTTTHIPPEIGQLILGIPGPYPLQKLFC